MIQHLIAVFRFKAGQDFTPFFLLADDQGICPRKIRQVRILGGRCLPFGLAVFFGFLQKFADDDAAAGTFFEG